MFVWMECVEQWVKAVSVVAGKLVMCRVYGIAYRRPQGEQLDQANPVRNEESGLWQCPFCLNSDFPELSEVSATLPDSLSAAFC